MATYNNYKLSQKRGFYLSSKTPVEGYEETSNLKGDKSYVKAQKDVKGVITNFGSKEITTKEGNKIDFLELTLKDQGDVINKISVNLFGKSGGYTTEAKTLISAMCGYKVGEPVTINTHIKKTEKDGKTYDNLNVYINYDNIKNESGKSDSTGFLAFKDIPAPVKTEKTVAGKKQVSWDWSDNTEYFYQKLQEITSRVGAPQAYTASTTTQEATTTTPPPAGAPTPQNKVEDMTFAEDTNDDLPF